MNQSPPAGGDQDRGPYVVAIFWTMVGISLLVLSLRFWGRLMIQKIGADDWMMVFTVILLIINASISTYDASLGGFRHLYYLSPQQTIEALKYSWVAQPWVIMGFTTGKISVGLLILRILGSSTVWRRWILYIGLGTALLFSILDIIFTFAQCQPVEALWNPDLVTNGEATCWNPKIQTDFAIFLASWNVLIDTLLAVLPVTIFWTLNLTLGRKLGLCLLLGLGLIAAVCAAIKTQYLASLSARSDLTWDTYDLYVWSAAELFVIIVCGSVPPIKPIYDRFVRGSKPYSMSSYYEYYGGNGSSEKKHQAWNASLPDGFGKNVAAPPGLFYPDLEIGPRELPGEEPYKPKKEHPAGDISVPMPQPPPLRTGSKNRKK